MMARVTDPDILRQLNAPPPPCKDGKTECKPWERDWPRTTPEKFGPGPYTLVISDGSAITRMDYKNGPACQRARDEVRQQVAAPQNSPGVIYAPSRTKAFCVSR
jgi:hypothetical protein